MLQAAFLLSCVLALDDSKNPQQFLGVRQEDHNPPEISEHSLREGLVCDTNDCMAKDPATDNFVPDPNCCAPVGHKKCGSGITPSSTSIYKDKCTSQFAYPRHASRTCCKKRAPVCEDGDSDRVHCTNDQIKYCTGWAANGSCENPFVKLCCKKSCNSCP
eukprot:GEMP01040348.1.p1 GENE.GEMP01040348.1~~GEMP01040348.1.p1  ORF type:complete len:160 (+),score=2.55 GEMP01040348.1:182-661(+)